jgi:glycosyltransferase involved in cell wall biosynthesis
MDAKTDIPPLVSIVIPAYNESECVDELAKRLRQVFDQEDSYRWECIVVENGSSDNTWDKLRGIHANDRRFKVLRLARNFRMDGGLTAGLAYARGDACVFMTADLQDPPEMIPEFLRKWEEGYENVYGIVTKRHGTGPIRTMNSKAFYWIAGKLSDNRIPKNASDFRLMDRKVYEAVRSMEERNRFVRGLVAWAGFKAIGIPMERPERFGGHSNAHSFGVVDLALKGIFAHSFVPLRVISLFGIAISLAAILGFLISATLWVTRGVPFSGFGTIVSVVLLLFGTLAFMLGILSEYVGLIYEEVKQRPNFVVADELGFQD